jgi:hypothetical protein
MADKVEKYVIDLNRLYLGSYRPMGLFFELEEVNQVWYGGAKMYNRALYSLEDLWASPARFFAGGGNLKSLLEKAVNSIKTDVADNRKENVEWWVEPETIAPNTDENNEKSGTYTISQFMSDLQITGTWVQEKDRVTVESITNVSIQNPMYPQATAIGGVWLPFSLSYSGTRKEEWASGKPSTSSPWSGSINSRQPDLIQEIKGRGLNGGTFDDSTGEVYAPNLGATPSDFQKIAVLTYIRFTDKGGNTREWSGNAYAWQAENVRMESGRTYDISSFLAEDGRTIGGGATTLYLRVYAYVIVSYEWSSRADGGSETINASVFLRASAGTLSSSAASGADVIEWDIPANETSSTRTLVLQVYNTDAGYDMPYIVYQEPFEEPETWGTPVLDGKISVTIPASGAATEFLVPIVQRKYKGDAIVKTFNGYVRASSVQGHAVESSGASFSGGYISCSSMGKQIFEYGREAYYAERIWVTGQDDRTYELDLDGEIIVIRQAKNTRNATHDSYILSVSASPSSGIANTGGKSTITASAQERFSVWYDSAPSSTTYETENITASLSATQGTLSKTSIYGTSQTATLTLDENIVESTRTSTVKLAVGGTSKSCTVSQNAAVYVWGEPSLAENVPSSGGTITFTIVSKLNGHACPITQVVTSLSGATIAEQPTLIDSSRGEYRFKVSVPENTSTQDRTFTVTATQFGSSDTKVWNVTQLKKSSTTTKIARFMAMFAFDGSNYGTVNITNPRLSAVGDDYSGGYVENLSLRVVNKSTGAIYGNSGNLGSFQVPNNGTISVSISSLSNSSNSKENVGVEVWYGSPSKHQQTFDIMQLETDK